MSSSPQEPGRDVGPLGSAVAPPSGNDDADGMAGPVSPPPETEPDASRDGDGDAED